MKTVRKSIIAAFLIGIIISGCKSSRYNGLNRSISLQNDIVIELVHVPKGFWIGKTEVTQAQWEAVMGNNPSHFKAPNNPVEHVSWDDCQEFLKTLNSLPVVKEAGLTFRLPTDDEWEVACRGESTGSYCKLSNGIDVNKRTLEQVAWFVGNSGGQPHPVGQKEPNMFGLYDMHGNVWEWSATVIGNLGVLHGGSYGHSAEFCEASSRTKLATSTKLLNLGFRLCASSRDD